MHINSNPDSFQSYLHDASSLEGGTSEGLFVPSTKEELIKFVKENYQGPQQALTIAGAGTGTVGGRVPFEGIIVSTEKLDKVLSLKKISKDEAYVTVQPGIILRDFQKQMAEEKYHLPPNPTETLSFCGSNAATGASGSRTFLWGGVRDYIVELEVLLIDGETFRIKRGENVFKKSGTVCGKSITLPSYLAPNLKFASGIRVKDPMDAIDLFIGSEGTLGIITEITYRLKKLPKEILGGIFFTKTFEEAAAIAKFYRYVRKQDPKNTPCSVEFFDEFGVEACQKHFGLSNKEAKFAIYLEQAIYDEDRDSIIERWLNDLAAFDILIDDSIISTDAKSKQRIIEFRHFIPEYLTEYFVKVGTRKVSSDAAVPEEHFDEFYKTFVELVNARNLKKVAFGHIGDCHLHIYILPSNKAESSKAWEVFELMTDKACKFGGVISAEHGIGKLKKKYLKFQYTKNQLQELLNIKNTFDPKHLLNRNVFFDYI